MEANSMNQDQTAPEGAVWSGSILFAKYGTCLSTWADERADDTWLEWWEKGLMSKQTNLNYSCFFHLCDKKRILHECSILLDLLNEFYQAFYLFWNEF